MYAHVYRIISILRAISAHNLIKCQYFSMKPSSFDNYHKTIKYHILCKIQHFSQFVIFWKCVFKNAHNFDQEWCFFTIPFEAVNGLNYPDRKVVRFFLSRPPKFFSQFLSKITRNHDFDAFMKNFNFWQENGSGCRCQRFSGLKTRPKN